MSTSSPLNADLVSFLESGLSMTVATRDPELWPAGARAWAVAFRPDRAHFTLFLSEPAAAAMLENLERCPEFALALDLPSTHRACQLKGRFLSARKARAKERPSVERQVTALRTDLVQIGVPLALTESWQPWPCSALELLVTHVYDQTPGPGTGGALAC